MNDRSRDIKRNILTDNEVKICAKNIQEMLVGATADIFDDRHYMEIGDNVRFISVATRCQEARVKKGINIKVASFVLKIPQYRLKAI